MRDFSWMHGIGMAPGFGIVNALWLDAKGRFASGHGKCAQGGRAGNRRS